MRKAYEYLDEIESVKFNQSDDIFHRNSVIEELIKRIQLETIEETCKVCAEKAKTKSNKILVDDIKEGENAYIFVDTIDKQSILNCAEILKKEL